MDIPWAGEPSSEWLAEDSVRRVASEFYHITARESIGGSSSFQQNGKECHSSPPLLRKVEIFQGAVPSRMFDAWVCGCPVALNIAGEARAVLERAGGGVFVELEEPARLAAALRDLAADRPRCREMGAAGRRFVEAHYSRQAQARQLVALLQNL